MFRCPNGLCYVALDVLAGPWRKKITFLNFSRSGTQIEGKQNKVSTTVPSLFDISSAMRGVG